MATRLYFTNNLLPNIAPAYNTAWGAASGLFQATRWVMKTTKDGITPTAGSTIDLSGAAGAWALDRQYVSPGLAGDQLISGRVSGQLMTREFNVNDNVDRTPLNIRVVSNDGTTVRGTLLVQSNYGATAELLNNGMRNHVLISGTAAVNVTPMTGFDGDRIVIEIGYQNSTAGTTPQGSALWGGGAFSSTDLPIDETTTTVLSPWLDLPGQLLFRQTMFIEMGDEES